MHPPVRQFGQLLLVGALELGVAAVDGCLDRSQLRLQQGAVRRPLFVNGCRCPDDLLEPLAGRKPKRTRLQINRRRIRDRLRHLALPPEHLLSRPLGVARPRRSGLDRVGGICRLPVGHVRVEATAAGHGRSTDADLLSCSRQGVVSICQPQQVRYPQAEEGVLGGIAASIGVVAVDEAGSSEEIEAGSEAAQLPVEGVVGLLDTPSLDVIRGSKNSVN
mmetsp:Transcript_15172/g.42345  ORF Transcript_15172/g.42345 Transcript_15172/m.42345 type:complete len:219 (+) Transcript_15172:343-999(+)